MENQIETSINEIIEYVQGCKQAAFSSGKVIVDRAILFDLLEELKLKTPDVIKRYQKIIANRDTIIAQAEESAEKRIEEAKAKAKQLVSEHEIMQQAYARANDMVSQAAAEADEMKSSAKNDAEQIRTGALNYANDIMSDMERILADSYESTKSRAENLIAALKDNYEVVSANRQELEKQLNGDEGQEDYGIEEPAAPAEQSEEDFDFNEDTFLDNIED